MDAVLEMTMRVGLAAAAGIALGANRWLHHKSAGVKTHALVAIGAAVAVLSVAPMDTGVVGLGVDALSRVLQGLITGVGFLGAGVIIHNARGKRIQGLTTAASIWVTTLIGAGIGMGHLALGAVAVTATGLVLLVGNSIERVVGARFDTRAPAPREEDLP